jgi:hypothetical protein
MNNVDSRHIFGAEIQYFRLEPKYWEPVLKQFLDTGLKCVTTYVQWGTPGKRFFFWKLCSSSLAALVNWVRTS